MMSPQTPWRCVVSVAVVAVGLAGVRATPAMAQDGWRMDGFNPSRTNSSAVSGPHSTPTVAMLAGNLPGSLRRVTDDGVSIVAGGNTVAAYDGSGVLKWQITVPAVVDVAVGPEGHVYVSTATTLDAFDPNSGVTVWSAPYVGNNGDESSSLAVGSDGTVFFHSGDSFVGGFGERLAALGADGSVKWETPLEFVRGYLRVVLSSDGTSVYLLQTKSSPGGPIGDVVRIDTATGAVLNDTPCDPRGNVYAFTDSGTLLTGEGSGGLIAFSPDLQTCNLLETGAQLVGIAALSTAGVIVTNVGLPSGGFGLAAIDGSGHPLWSSATQYATNAYNTYFQYEVADAAGVLYATSGDGNSVSAIDMSNGSVLWTHGFAAAVSGVLLGGDGNLYVTSGSQLIRLSAPTCLAPVITTEPINQITTVGTPVHLSVAASAGTPLRYEWFVGSRGDTSSPVVGAVAPTFTPSSFTGTGSFWVRVFDSCGSTDSSAATVTVTAPPKGRGYSLVIAKPKGLSYVGSSAAVYVLASDDGLPASGVPVTIVINGANNLTFTQRTGPDGQAVFTYVGSQIGRDTITASSPIVPRDLISNTVTLGWIPPPPATLDLPGFAAQQEFKRPDPSVDATKLEAVLAQVFTNEVINPSVNDSCYGPAASAAYYGAAASFERSLLKKFTGDFVSLTLGFPTDSVLTSVVLKASQFLIAVSTSDHPAQTALEEIVTDAIEYVSSFSTLPSDLAALGVDQTANKLFGSVVAAQFSGNNTNDFQSFAEAPASAYVQFMYNPDTRYAAVGVNASCDGGATNRTYVIRFFVDIEKTAGLQTQMPQAVQAFVIR